MSNLLSLTSVQFRKAAEIKDQIEALTNELAGLLGSQPLQSSIPAKRGRPKKMIDVPAIIDAESKPQKHKKMSKSARAKISAAQKARWAKVKGTEVETALEPNVKTSEPKKKRKMSAEGKARLVAAQKARWAKFHAQKKA